MANTGADPSAETTAGASRWSDEQWGSLLLRIKQKKCTPFLGAGACAGTLPLGGQIAQRWAESYGYPFEDRHNLPRVAQYVAVKQGDLPRLLMHEELDEKGPPDFTRPDEIHAVVARLGLPVYITTNYDDFMMKALTQAGRKPHVEVCPWATANERRTPGAAAPAFNDPTAEEPLVYHMHGTLGDDRYMVLTEDDYLDFLVAVSETRLIPTRVERSFSESLLFLGYSLEDMNFKVLFRKLASFMSRTGSGAVHLSVQLSPSNGSAGGGQPSADDLKRVAQQQEYLGNRLGLQKVDVFWGTCQQFAQQLGRRWDAFKRT